MKSDLERIVSRVQEGVQIQLEYYGDGEGWTRQGLALHLIKVIVEEVLVEMRPGRIMPPVSGNQEVRDLSEPFIQDFITRIHSALTSRHLSCALDAEHDVGVPIQGGGGRGDGASQRPRIDAPRADRSPRR